MFRWTVIFTLYLALFQTAWAQNPYFIRESIGEEYGKIRYQTSYIDSSSIVWIGTDKGLFRFEDIGFTHIGEGSVTAISQSASGAIWVGMEDGRLFEVIDDQLQLANSGPHPETRITGFAQTEDGLWIATYGGGLWKATNHTVQQIAPPALAQLQDIYCIVPLNNKEIWLGTDDGIVICEQDSDRIVVERIDQTHGLPDQIITALSVTHTGKVWAGTFDMGLVGIDSNRVVQEVLPKWSMGAITCIQPVVGLELWIGTADHGLMRYTHTGAKLQQIDIPGGNAPQLVHADIDDEGNLWLLDEYNGIYRTNRLFQAHYTPLKNIQALLFDKTGNTFFGTPAGLFMTSGVPSEAQPRQLIGDVNVLSLFIDIHNQLWIGTFGQGLFRMSPELDHMDHYTRDHGLTDESILAITGWREKIWLATLGGVTEIDVNDSHGGAHSLTTQNYNLSDGLGTNFIYTAMADRQGRIWFGTDGNGLSVLDGGSLRNYMYVDSIELHSVYSVAEDTRGRIWCSTDRAGLVVFEGDSLRRPYELAGVRDIEVSSIAADTFGNILLCHENGIDMCIPDRQEVIYYEGEVGLLDFAPNLNALFKDDNGHIWIGGRNRIIEYTPLSSATRFSPRNMLTGVELYLDRVDFSSQHTFASRQNYLTFRYRGIWHTNPQDVRFRYMVEGLDPDWKFTRERSVTYQRIPPGTYTFIVQAAVSDYFKQTGSASYAFTIRKPLHKQPWFLALVATMFVLVLWIIVRQREARLARRAEMRRQQVEAQLQTLKAQINPHFLFNSFNTLVSAIEEDPPKAVEYVESLSDFYRSILQYRERNTIQLREELEIVRNYAYLMQTRFGRNLIVEVHIDNLQGLIVPLTLQMLIENAIKHNVISRIKPLTITISQVADNYLVVHNAIQRKQTSEDSTQYGLDSIVRRYELITARPVVVEETRASFSVKIPILRKNEVPHH